MAFRSLEDLSTDLSFEFTIVENCDDALIKIKGTSENDSVDLIFLDISLPPSKDGTILSGEDLGDHIKQFMPNSKLIVSTTYNDNYRLYNLLENLNPDGFLVKNDITPSILIEAIKDVLENKTFYSSTVFKLVRKTFIPSYTLDKLDRQLLFELSKGTKMSELPKIIPMSMGGLERRKRILKEVLEIENIKSDRELIEKAKEIGFL